MNDHERTEDRVRKLELEVQTQGQLLPLRIIAVVTAYVGGILCYLAILDVIYRALRPATPQ